MDKALEGRVEKIMGTDKSMDQDELQRLVKGLRAVVAWVEMALLNLRAGFFFLFCPRSQATMLVLVKSFVFQSSCQYCSNAYWQIKR